MIKSKDNASSWDDLDEEPVVVFAYRLAGDIYISDGRIVHVPRWCTFPIDPGKDQKLISRIMKLDPWITGLASSLAFPPGVVLKRTPETLEEALSLLEKHSIGGK